jgi:Spy/CpxP family protein refolding chaperone
MKKIITILLALFLLTQGSTMAAQSERDRSERGMMSYEGGYGCSNVTANDNLKLTPEQGARIRALEEKCVLESESIRGRLYGKGRELKTEWLQTAPDRGRIEILHGEVTKLQGWIRDRASDHRTEILDILTPEQQTLVEEAERGRDLHQERVRFRSKRERR